MASKLKKDDEVVILAGKDKGRRGTVNRVVVKGGRKKLFVDGINMIKKHVRPNPQANQQGGIVEQEAPIDASNVAIYNPATKKADRVGFKLVEDGENTKKVRIFRSTGEQIDI
jgi:large subunit ribosomal protein L24